MNHRPVASPEKSDDAIMGTKTSNYSGHGLTLKQPRGLWAAMSNMGKVWPCRRTKEKKKKTQGGFCMGTVEIFRAGITFDSTSTILE